MSIDARIPTASSKSAAQVATNGGTAQFVATQPDGQWLARVLLGSAVQNSEGHTIGDINDLVFDHTGQISSVVLGVGGFLGMGEKIVAVPFTALTFNDATDGTREIIVRLGKSDLLAAPAFEAVDKTTLDNVREIAAGLGHKASDAAIGLGHKASEAVVGLKDQAVKKIGELNKDTPKPL